MKPNRNYYFDNIKAWLIILVVLGHFIEPLIENKFFLILYTVVYAFHMPMFAFASGFYSKPSLKGLKSLFKTFITFQVVYGIFMLLIFIIFPQNHATIESTSTTLEILDIIPLAFTPYWLLWYLLSLIFWRLLLFIFNKSHLMIIIAILLSIFIGIVDIDGRTLSYSRTISLFPFFLLGYYLTESNLSLVRTFFKKKYACFLLITITLILWVCYYFNANHELFYYANNFEELGCTLTVGFALKVLTLLISFFTSLVFMLIVSEKKSMLSNIGKETLNIYLYHGFIYWIIYSFGFYTYLQTTNLFFQVIIIIALTMSSVYSLSKIFKNRRYYE